MFGVLLCELIGLDVSPYVQDAGLLLVKASISVARPLYGIMPPKHEAERPDVGLAWTVVQEVSSFFCSFSICGLILPQN